MAFFLVDRTLSRSVTLNLEADFEDLPAPAHPKQISILILFLFNYLLKFLTIQKTGYLLDIMTEPEDTSCESWVFVVNDLIAGSSLLKAASLSSVAGDGIRNLSAGRLIAYDVEGFILHKQKDLLVCKGT
ncbi:hypothetical protein HanXRQr2_Chr10g0452331 [Helianthus annuus]|uniref:Uncharacterized protein n=1 Tax=Helianthus annuus TaxID=4232 RepID=A0A9K3N4X8_HELAN|nr:hypothetical protein HanXRQr2_Chr10g0452331 [Helianthus annuus]